MVLTIMIGATSVATELSTMATTAATKGFFSSANRGMNFPPDSRRDRFCRGPFAAVSSVYFIVARTSLGVVELDIFRRCLHQFLVGSHGQKLALHQEDDLVVVNDRGNLLRHRYQRDAGIILVYVLQNGPFGGSVHACRRSEERRVGKECRS